VATWDDVERLALALPETDEGTTYGNRAWRVAGKPFAWERPLRASDLAALGERAPDGPILAARVEEVLVRDALIEAEPDVYLTTPHFEGYPIVLVQLDAIAVDALGELLADAWTARAPARLLRG